ncbi:MAG: Npt1/Npt2 family nucleotide transporter [Caldilineaceae bacterium]
MGWGERFGVRSGEGRKVALVFALFFFGGLARSFTSSGAYSLFLASFGGEMLPYVYVAAGATTALIMYGNLHLGDRISFAKLLALNFGVSIALSLVLPLALRAGQPPWLIFAFPVWYECLIVLLPSVLWSTAGYLFTVRQGKRLFGLVSSGLPLGFIVSGLLTSWLVGVIGSPNLLLLAGVSLGAALLLALWILRSFPIEQVSTTPAGGGETGKGEPLWKNTYVLLILGMLAAWTLAFFIVDNVFYNQVGVRYPDQSAMAAFLGTYSIARGILMLVTGLLLTGPFLSRFGVRLGTLALPAALAVGITPLVLVGSLAGLVPWLFWPAFATKLLNYAFDAIDRASVNILYQPLPPVLRARVPTFAEGVVQPIMTAAAGILLVVLTSIMGFSVVHLGFVLLIVIVVWIAVALAIGRQYSGILMRALVRRRLGDERFTLDDESSRLVLQQALASPNADVVLYALNRLPAGSGPSGAPGQQEAMAALLDHPMPTVRRNVLARIEQKGTQAILPAVQGRLAVEDSAAVRGVLLRALAALEPAEAFDIIAPALDDPEPPVREGAAVGLMRHTGIGGVLAVGQRILLWAGSPQPEERASAARVLGAVGDAHFYQPLIPMLSDPDVRVQRAAIEAAGHLRSPRLLALLIDKLDSTATGPVCVAALLGAGDAALPLIDAAFIQKAHTQLGRETAGLVRLAQICGRMRTPAASALLSRHLRTPQPAVRRAVLHALTRCNCQAQPGTQAAVYAQIRAEGEAAAWTLHALQELQGEEQATLLRAALEREYAAEKANILDLLSFICPPDAVRRAQDILSASKVTTDQRAYALETLDIVTPQELKPIVMPLVDELTIGQRQQRLDIVYHAPAMNRAERICNIIVDGSDRFTIWTQACAIDAVARLGLLSLAGVVLDVTRTQDPLLRETAVATLAKMEATAVGRVLAFSVRGATFLREQRMLSTIERVIILKTVSIFASVPDDTLAAVAGALDEVEVAAGTTVFSKGDLGQAMYIIVAGSVRIHDGEQTINRLGTYDVFGEMALLDSEPRSASVTADEDTLLLRLQQDDFFELFEDHSAIARGIIQVLSRRLRARSEEIAKLRSAGAQ